MYVCLQRYNISNKQPKKRKSFLQVDYSECEATLRPSGRITDPNFFHKTSTGTLIAGSTSKQRHFRVVPLFLGGTQEVPKTYPE